MRALHGGAKVLGAPGGPRVCQGPPPRRAASAAQAPADPCPPLQLPRPLTSAARLPPPGFLQPFAALAYPPSDFFGYKLTVAPRFSRAFELRLLQARQEQLERAVRTQAVRTLRAAQRVATALLTRGSPPPRAQQWTLTADHQLAELVSHICDKQQGMLSTGAPAQARGSLSAREKPSLRLSPLRMSPATVSGATKELLRCVPVRHPHPAPAPLTYAPASLAAPRCSCLLIAHHLRPPARYPELEACDASELELRFAVLRLLNARVASLLPLIDWSRASDPQSLAFLFRRVRGIVFSQLKFSLWNRALSSSSTVDRMYGRSMLELDRRRATLASERADRRARERGAVAGTAAAGTTASATAARAGADGGAAGADIVHSGEGGSAAAAATSAAVAAQAGDAAGAEAGGGSVDVGVDHGFLFPQLATALLNHPAKRLVRVRTVCLRACHLILTLRRWAANEQAAVCHSVQRRRRCVGVLVGLPRRAHAPACRYRRGRSVPGRTERGMRRAAVAQAAAAAAVRQRSQQGAWAGTCTAASPHCGLPCGQVGFTLDKWVPNPACSFSEHLKLFEALGRMMGVAARLHEPLALDLPPTARSLRSRRSCECC